MEFLRASINGEKIPMGFATPRREFGTQEEMNPMEAGDVPVHGSKTIKLPSMVVQRLNWTLAENRMNYTRHRKIRWSDDLNLVTQAQHPIAYDIAYQLDIWTKYRDDANILTSAVIIKFPRRMASLQVDLGHPWGVKKVFLGITSVVDNTELESEDGDREVRMTIDLNLEAWMPLPPTDVRTVRKVLADTQIMWFDDARGIDAEIGSVVLEEK